MKNYLLRSSLLVLAGLFISLSSFAQDNVIKWRPLKLVNPVTRGLSLGYERVVGDQASFSIGAKYILPKDLSGIDLTFTDENSVETGTGIIDAGSLKGFTLTPELRFYTVGRWGAPKGFYLGPFVRYFNYNADPAITHTNTQQEVSQLDTRFAFSGLGGGGNLGFQWVWENGLSLDWNIGAGVAVSKARFSGTVSGQLEEDLDQALDKISTQLGGIPINIGKLTNEGTELNARTPPFPWVILRSELALGFAF